MDLIMGNSYHYLISLSPGLQWTAREGEHLMKTLLEKDEDQRSTRKIMEPPEDVSAQHNNPVKDRTTQVKGRKPQSN